ncbi:MAG: hypothetical protein NTY77_15050 [Elusimicrobia bacterium]|nr:hypothetical protein [Elusimicrobiota bacterium]
MIDSKVLCAGLLASLALLQPAQAGPLKQFEKAAATPAPSRSSDRSHQRSSPDAGDSVLGALMRPFMEEIGAALGYCFVCSGERSLVYALGEEDRSAAMLESCGFEGKSLERRKHGDILIPFARADAGYQAVQEGVSAVDVRAEAGYALLAVSVRRTSYWQRKSDETMSTTALVPEYRMLFGGAVEADLGFGPFFLDGAAHHAGTILTLPILIHPAKHLGLEFRPAWANLEGGPPIADYGLNVVLRAGYVALYGGYRWLRSGGVALDGPVGGLSAYW